MKHRICKKQFVKRIMAVMISSLLVLSLCACEEAKVTAGETEVVVYSKPIEVVSQAPDINVASSEETPAQAEIVSEAEGAQNDEAAKVSEELPEESSEELSEETENEKESEESGNPEEQETAKESSEEQKLGEQDGGTPATAATPVPETPVSATTVSATPGAVENVAFNPAWTYADFSLINSGCAVMYRASANRRNIVVGVNAGHGTKGGTSVKTYCHPDMTPKVTGGSTAAGSLKATAVSSGMAFYDGTAEASVTLREAQILRDKLLNEGFDVLMVRDGSDVQLDNVARTVMCNNLANCHIAIHWDGDNLDYDKGCFYISVPDGIKNMVPVSTIWPESERLGKSLISGLKAVGAKIYGNGSTSIDLTQTSYSSIPSVDVELGNAASAHDDASLSLLADGLVQGIKSFF